MTISSTTVKNSYSGNGSTTEFAYAFKIFANTDLQVIIRSSTGAETVKTLTTHYTVSGAGDASGGAITFTSGNTPASGETVVIRRAVPQTQAIDYIANDPFPAETHEEGLDRATMTTQQMQEELDRSFKVSRTNTITTPEFTDDASTRASKTLGFDSDGNLTTVADFLPAGGDSAMFQYSTTTTDADPGAGYFRLNHATIASATEIYVDDLEYNGTDISAWVQSWDDVSGNDTNRGRIKISKAQSLDTWMIFKVSGAVTDASGYTKVTLVHIDSAGTFSNDDKCWIAFTSSGEDGAIPGYYYKFDTGTSDADPGAGEIAFNNGTYASATEIYIDDADANGASTATDVQSWGGSTSTIKGFLHIVDINDSSTYARFKITAAVSDESGYNKITVAHLASNNTFSAADELSVHYTRTGLKGDTGSTGATGSTGSTGSTGASGTNSQLSMTWSSSTSDADPGAGKIAWNHGTIASATILYVDDADDASADISGYVQSWDDVSNSTARGIVTITKEGTASTYATFKVSGAVTDASGYTKVPVTHVVSSGSFSNTDGVGVHFSYSGQDSAVTASSTTTFTNKTLTSPKINEDVAMTSTSTELNKLDALSRGSILYGNASAVTSVLTKGGASTVLTSDGTDISWSAASTGRTGTVDWCTTVKTSDFTSVSAKGYFVNTSGGAVTVTLPASPSAGDIVAIKDYAGTWGTACKALTIGRNSSKMDGDCANAVRDTAHESLTLVYVDGTQGWKSIEEGTGYIGETFMCASGGNTTITSGDYKTHIFTSTGTFTVNSISQSAPNNIVDYGVMAGGGGGGSNNYGGGSVPRGSGGGGAGGFRIYSTAPGSNSPLNNSGASPNTAITVTATSYPVTIGAGGAGAPSGSPDSGSSGNNTVFSSVTSAAGGNGGGHCNSSAGTGGSGGGGRNAVTGGAGNTPPVAPPQGNPGGDGAPSSGNFDGSGGGGAGAAGSDGCASPGNGRGGAGSYIADPFFGPTAPSYGSPGPASSTRYFAGGGAGSPGPGAAVCGGAGGGGPKGTAGTANTGGGGGANSPGAGGAGGSGIVMIRYKFQ